MNTAAENSEQANNVKRKKSMVWDHFTIQHISAGCKKASCNQCKKSFAYVTDSKLAGTSHLRRHITAGICPVERQKNKAITQGNPSTPLNTDVEKPTTLPKKRNKSAPVPAPVHEIAKMIMLHEYPLNMVEHTGFNVFLQAIQPKVSMLDTDSIQGECLSIYAREKQGLSDLLNGSLGRVNLTLDLWASHQSLGYVILTGYFIDSDWKLHRRILNVVMLPFPDSESAFNHAVVACVNDWGLDNKLFSLTLDQSFATEAVTRNLRGLLSIKNPNIIGGQLLLGNCYARVISHLALDALGSMVETVKKVRNSVKYVKTAEEREEKFMKLKQKLQTPSTKSLMIDDRTKWDTTYHMLVAASELKQVFSCLDTSDPDYKETLSSEEWKQVEVLCSYLKLFFEAANILTAPACPTSDIFFHEVWKIQLELTHAAMSADTFVSNLAKPLLESFTEYWNGCNLILAAAVTMDPRSKLELVKYSFSNIYGKDAGTWVTAVIEGIHELFMDYIALALPAPTFVVEDCENLEIDEMTPEDALVPATDDGMSDLDVYISEMMMSSQHMKSELDLYLEEPLLPRSDEGFDILAWWKENMEKYPTLSRMAADILSIPVCTVATDSVFDTETKKMDSYLSSQSPATVQALICAKDWLKYGPPNF